MSRRTTAAIVASLAACGPGDVTEGRYQGMVELEQLDLGFELPGRLAGLEVRAGAVVVADAVIARQDDALDREQRELRARELAVAQAELALVRAGSRAEDVRASRAQLVGARATEQSLGRDVERARTLVARGALAGAQLDQLEAQLARAAAERATLEERVRVLAKGARTEDVARAQARVALAEQAVALEDLRLGKRVLTSPVAGTVLDTFLDPGELAAAGAIVATIVDRHRPFADVFVPVGEAPRVTTGGAAVVVVEGRAGELAGVVERVFPNAEFTPRFVYSPRERPNLMIRVRVRIADVDGALHAGLPAYVRFPAAGAAPGEHPP